jgi:archaellum component FlaC
LLKITEEDYNQLKPYLKNYQAAKRKFANEQFLYRRYLIALKNYEVLSNDTYIESPYHARPIEIIYKKVPVGFKTDDITFTLNELYERLHSTKKNIRIFNHDKDIAYNELLKAVDPYREKYGYNSYSIINILSQELAISEDIRAAEKSLRNYKNLINEYQTKVCELENKIKSLKSNEEGIMK